MVDVRYLYYSGMYQERIAGDLKAKIICRRSFQFHPRLILISISGNGNEEVLDDLARDKESSFVAAI